MTRIQSIFAWRADVSAAAVRRRQRRAQADYPSRPIHFIVGFAAGGGNDLFARLVMQKFQEQHRRTPRSSRTSPAPAAASLPTTSRISRPTATRCWSAPPGRCRSPPPSFPISTTMPTTSFIAAQHDRVVPAGAGGAGESSGQEREGTGGLGEGQSRQVELRHLVARLHHHHRTVQAQDRHAGDRDPVQGQQRVRTCAWSASSACSRFPTGRRRSRWCSAARRGRWR